MGCILVVEDNDDLRMLYKQALTNEGHEVLLAANGLEALNILRAKTNREPGVIILDLMMPVMDGWEFLKEQAKDPSFAHVPVVVCSASRDNLPPGIRYMKKPVELDSVLALVAEHCQSV